MQYKIGDRVRVIHPGECRTYHRHQEAAYAIITNITRHGYAYDRLTADHRRVADCYNCLVDADLQLIKQGDNKVSERRTFKLIKDGPSMKKGAIVQERCDDGTQPYDMLNADTHSKDPGYTPSFQSRELVENQPDWFVEVFKVTPEYMTKEELDNFEVFKAAQKGRAAKKAANKVARASVSKQKSSWTPARRRAHSERISAMWAAKAAAKQN